MIVRASATRVSGEIDDRASGDGKPTVIVLPPGAVARTADLECARVARGLDDDGRPDTGFLELRGGVDGRRAEFACGLQLLGDGVDADHLAGTPGDRRQDRGHPHSTEPDDHHGLAGLRIARVEDGTAAGEDGASEHGRHIGGDVVADGNDRAAVDDRVRRESGHPEVVVHGVAAAVQSRSPVEQGSVVVRTVPGTHGIRPSVAQPSHSPQRGRNVMTTAVRP